MDIYSTRGACRSLVIIGKRCDRCGRVARASDNDYGMELQEFKTINVDAGYGASAFVDGDFWTTDLCQHCVREVLGDYLRRVSTAEDRSGDPLAHMPTLSDAIRLEIARAVKQELARKTG